MAHKPGIYGRLARFALHNRKVLGPVLLLLTALAAVLGLPPEVDPNLLELLPKEEPSVRALHRLVDEEGGVNLVTLAVGSEQEAELDAFTRELAAALEGSELVDWAITGVDSELATDLGLLQLETADVQELTVRMRAGLALGPAMNPIVAQRLLEMGPVAERIQKAAKNADLLSDAPGRAKVLMKPVGSAHDQDFALALMDTVDAELAKAAAAHPAVEVLWVGGAYRHNVEDVRGIRQDLAWTSIASGVLVLTVIIVTFRSVRATVLVFTPLAVASIFNLAFADITLGHLNTYTSFTAAILLGLGIDFAVHLVGRYREYRALGRDLEAALVEAWDRTGPPCMTAALTSASGFLALSAADFQGFAQLGILLATGLMFCLVAMLVGLPMLIPSLDGAPTALLGTQTHDSSSVSSYALAPVGLMVAIVVTGLLGARVIPNLEWEFDSSALRRDGLSYSELSETERALANDSYTPLVWSLEDEASMVEAQRTADALIEQGKLPHIARAVSVAKVLPADQSARVAALQELIPLLDHKNLRYLPPPFVKQLLPLRGRDPKVLSVNDLPEPVRDLLGGGEGRYRVLLVPEGNMWDLRETGALHDEVRAALGDAEVAGEYVALGALFRMVRRDMPIVGILAFLFVAALTAIDLRRVHWTVGALGTLLGGMIWASAAVSAAGVKLSILNIVGVPILLGIGVDVVIHLLHRLSEEGPGGVRRALRTTGVAALVSTLTTVLSFASLTLAGNRGVRSLGLLVVLGLVAVFIASATLLPLSWSAGWRLTGRAPADNQDDPDEAAPPA